MLPKKFPKGEALRFGWTTTKSNLGFFIGLLIAVGLIYIVPDIISGLIEESDPILSIVIDIASLALWWIIGMGLIRIALRFCDNEKGKFGDLFSCWPLFFKYLLGSILYALIVLGGLVLLIVPGIIWAIKFGFYNYFIVDKGLGPIQALKASSSITKGTKWELFLFFLLLSGIELLGVLPVDWSICRHSNDNDCCSFCLS